MSDRIIMWFEEWPQTKVVADMYAQILRFGILTKEHKPLHGPNSARMAYAQECDSLSRGLTYLRSIYLCSLRRVVAED